MKYDWGLGIIDRRAQEVITETERQLHDAKAELAMCRQTMKDCAGTCEELKALVRDLALQLVYRGVFDGQEVVHTGGLSVLEDTFEVLGWPDPMLVSAL